MKNYYKVLEVSEAASEAAIKKAYFTMVRRYTPERDPEKFQEIREAYEALKAGEKSEEPTLTATDNPWAVKLYDQISSRLSQYNYELAASTAEEALYHFPKEDVFRYYLALAQRKAGYTGKAVKNCELLVAGDPNNRLYHRELAIAYMDRGYSKKAMTAFKKAYDMGTDDPDFMLRYSEECEENDRYKEGFSVLLALVEKKQRWKREEIPEILEAYAGTCALVQQYIAEYGERIGKDFLGFLREYIAYLDENAKIAVSVYMTFMEISASLPQCRELMRDIFRVLDKSMYTEEGRSLISVAKDGLISFLCEGDQRLGITTKRGLEAFLTAIDIIKEPSLIRYAQLDVKLCMLQEMPDILKDFTILQTDYPEYYENIREFAETLRENKNLQYLKEKLQKEYDRCDEYMSGGRYYSLYPQERKGRGQQIYDAEQPFVREGRKIGRNDLCPCGSGKKYKLCCGKNR